MTKEDQILQALGKVQGQMEGVNRQLANGGVKMGELLEMGNKNGENIAVLKEHCESTHADCAAVHQVVSDGCAVRKLEADNNINGKSSKITLTFNNLMKLLGFVAIIATCGMVAAGNWG